LANTYVDLYRWGRNSRDLEEGQRTALTHWSSIRIWPKDMLLSARHSPFSESSKKPRPNSSVLSKSIPLSSTHIIFMRGLHSKLEISRGQSSCLKKRANHDRKIIRHQRYGLLRCT